MTVNHVEPDGKPKRIECDASVDLCLPDWHEDDEDDDCYFNFDDMPDVVPEELAPCDCDIRVSEDPMYMPCYDCRDGWSRTFWRDAVEHEPDDEDDGYRSIDDVLDEDEDEADAVDRGWLENGTRAMEDNQS